METIEEISARKAELIRRSDAERNNIALVYYQWQARTSVARQVTGILKNPLILTGLGAGLGLVFLKLPWRRSYKFGGWVWRAWRIVRTIRRLWI